ncbi:MAG: SDR family NAD(P)-dependent oxidoreductase [Planctomycetota bacterium]|jgi:short-subunit dehydrogenase
MPEPTALVTGASSGIGRELARALAAGGHDLALVARRRPLLEELARDLAATHGVRAEVVAVDLSGPGGPTEIHEWASGLGLRIGCLVNNAGFAGHGGFADLPRELQLEQVTVNVCALVELTHLFLPAMIEHGEGRVLNVASTAAFQPGPYMAVYFASKAFVLSFSEALASELRGTGVTVTALCPGPTESGFWERAEIPSSGLVERAKMDAARVARVGYRGMMAGKAIVVPGFKNRLGALLVRLLPRSWVRGAIRRFQRRIIRGSGRTGSRARTPR